MNYSMNYFMNYLSEMSHGHEPGDPRKSLGSIVLDPGETLPVV